MLLTHLLAFNFLGGASETPLAATENVVPSCLSFSSDSRDIDFSASANRICIGIGEPEFGNFLLLEDGSFLLLEDGFKILLEE